MYFNHVNPFYSLLFPFLLIHFLFPTSPPLQFFLFNREYIHVESRGFEFPWAVVIGRGELSDMGAKNQSASIQEQCVLLIAEPPPTIPYPLFFF